jgi:hypothetical protein
MWDRDLEAMGSNFCCFSWENPWENDQFHGKTPDFMDKSMVSLDVPMDFP